MTPTTVTDDYSHIHEVLHFFKATQQYLLKLKIFVFFPSLILL